MQAIHRRGETRSWARGQEAEAEGPGADTDVLGVTTEPILAPLRAALGPLTGAAGPGLGGLSLLACGEIPSQIDWFEAALGEIDKAKPAGFNQSYWK